MKKLLIIGIILSSLSGCAHQVPTINLHNQFNPAEAKKLLEEGLSVRLLIRTTQ